MSRLKYDPESGMMVPNVVKIEAAVSTDVADGIIAPKAKDRFYEILEREQMPSSVKSTLQGALNGNLRNQGAMFESMLDSWPRLQSNMNEVAEKVRDAEFKIEPYSEEGEEPTESAIEKAKFVEGALNKMKSDPKNGSLDFKGLKLNLATGYFTGHNVNELFWADDSGAMLPTTAKNVPWRYFGYPYSSDADDRLMLSPDGFHDDLEDFPEHKFIIGVNKGHNSHPSVSAPLRALSMYWLAVVYGMKWLLNFAQLFGQPIRWAGYSDPNTKQAIMDMLANMGG